SNFCIVTLNPRSTSRRSNEAAAIPFPREETTPPVTKMYLVALVPLGMDAPSYEKGWWATRAASLGGHLGLEWETGRAEKTPRTRITEGNQRPRGSQKLCRGGNR